MAQKPYARSTGGPLGSGLPPAVALVDGNMMAKAAYHTTGDMIAETTGQSTGVLYGFVKMLGTLMWNFPTVQEIHVLWDSYPSWRAVEFPYYKAARGARLPSTDPAGEDSWNQQKDLLQQILPMMNVHQIRAANMEADDLAYLIPRSPLSKGRHTILVSNDRDWLQLVDKRTHVFRGAKKDLVTPANFAEITKYGSPELVVELKAIIGDGDEFPGCYGVGEKTALAYLQGDDVQAFRQRKIDEWLKTEQYRHNLILASIPESKSRYTGEVDLIPGKFQEKELFREFGKLEFYTVLERWQDFCSRYRYLQPPGGLDESAEMETF